MAGLHNSCSVLVNTYQSKLKYKVHCQQTFLLISLNAIYTLLSALFGQ